MIPILIELSPEDIAMAGNAMIMAAKNRIIRSVYELFGRLADNYREAAMQLPEAVQKIHPKISKGENYLGLPWVMLDYPRNFSETDIFAIRTLFWWGNYFSLQLLLKGRYMEMLDFISLEESLGNKEWFFYTGNDIWQHQLQENDMVPVNSLTPEIIQEQENKNGFYKIGAKLPVVVWNNAEKFLMEKFTEALKIAINTKIKD